MTIKCKLYWCKFQAHGVCTRDEITVEDGCKSFEAIFKKDLNKLEMAIESSVAGIVNRFKMETGFSLESLHIDIGFEQSTEIGGNVETMLSHVTSMPTVLVNRL